MEENLRPVAARWVPRAAPSLSWTPIGTRLTPAQHADSSLPSRNRPRTSPPVGDRAALREDSSCDAMKTFAVGSRFTTLQSASVSGSASTRTSGAPSTGGLADGNHGATLASSFAISLAHLLRDPHCFFYQCLNNLILRDSLYDFTLDKDLSLAVS